MFKKKSLKDIVEIKFGKEMYKNIKWLSLGGNAVGNFGVIFSSFYFSLILLQEHIFLYNEIYMFKYVCVCIILSMAWSISYVDIIIYK